MIGDEADALNALLERIARLPPNLREAAVTGVRGVVMAVEGLAEGKAPAVAVAAVLAEMKPAGARGDGGDPG